ncbi:MAG: hypothetical protein KJ852_16605 [Gammaproteobacteria bacterium]|nr:hypothetical protein [Gammaproteobacteria bacterium]MBU0786844.1 hypothetical protein [Gammaproteobacteria bacterium]MBU0813950.1 hypothetical protein [Gammaproteobacteria bacterium]MBU1788577.1 hypothetical protein [Gammaproteobacteria bacterium]
MQIKDATSYRKISSGLTRRRVVCQLKIRGYHLAVAGESGPVAVIFPPALLKLMGWRKGLRLKVRAKKGGLTLSEQHVSTVFFSMNPRKRQGAERIRFERRWQLTLQSIQKDPKRRQWEAARRQR